MNGLGVDGHLATAMPYLGALLLASILLHSLVRQTLVKSICIVVQLNNLVAEAINKR